MDKIRIAVIGAGNAGCLTSLHLKNHLDLDKFEIVIYHDPSIPIESTGQATTPSTTNIITGGLGQGCNWYENKIDAVFKTGFLYKDWGKVKDEIWHPFWPMDKIAMHYSPRKLSQEVLNSGLFTVKEGCVNDPEKELDCGAIFDCRGRNKLDDNYTKVLNPINAALLYKSKEPVKGLFHTEGVATPHGWTFIIPGLDCTYYGYLYNHQITNRAEAEDDFKNRFNATKVDTALTFDSYRTNSIFRGERTILNGNKAVFIEPLEASSTFLYEFITRTAFDCIFNGKSREEADMEMTKDFLDVEMFILWHYQFGSKYNTPFWKYAKSLPFNPSDEFLKLIESDKSSKAILGRTQWSAGSFKGWVEGVRKE